MVAHIELTPYLMYTGTHAYLTGTSSITPMQPKPKNLPILQYNNITTYAYMLGDQIFVSPIVEANVTSQTITLPDSSYEWYVCVTTRGGMVHSARPSTVLPPCSSRVSCHVSCAAVCLAGVCV